MSRVKFQAPIEPSKIELLFIQFIHNTNDYNTYDQTEFAYVLNTNERTLRLWKERYNNRKYINIVPQGKIVSINGYYRIVRPDTPLANYYIRKAKFDKLCAIIDEYNTRLLLGEIKANGQLQFEEQFYSIDEIIELAKEYDQE